MSEHILRVLSYTGPEGESQTLGQHELYKISNNLVILGEAGMGKSTLMAELAYALGGGFCTARQLINRHDPRSLIGNASTLVIDALDEVAAAAEGDAVDRLLQKLGALDYPRFILACRAADWRAATGMAAIKEQYPSTPLELTLEPLGREQQRDMLAQRTGSSAHAEALIAHFSEYDLELLGNPQTLEMIARLPEGQPLPTTSSGLFELAADQLRREHNEIKAAKELPTERALAAAGAAFAALLLTGSSAIVDRASANAAEGELTLAEVAALAGDDIAKVKGTRLFSYSAAGFTYAHRRIGEYLAARWLATQANRPAKRKRLLAMLQSEGRVPASLRGLFAWLALDPEFAGDVIAADPLGLMTYGDADVLSAQHARALLHGMQTALQDNPGAFAWRDFRAASLATPALLGEIKAIIADRGADYLLRRLLVKQLSGRVLSPNIVALLEAILLDRDDVFTVRAAAGQILLSVPDFDWAATIELLRRHGATDDRRLAFELLVDDGPNRFSDLQIVETLLAYDGLTLCPAIREPADRTILRFSGLELKLDIERIAGLLDIFSDWMKALLPPNADIEENDLLDLFYSLVMKQLALGPPDPTRLWGWIGHLKGRHHYQRDAFNDLQKWLATETETRRAIQRLVVLPERDEQRFRLLLWSPGDASAGLSINREDALALLQLLDPEDRTDERWRELLLFGGPAGEDGRVLREAAKRFARHRPDLLIWIDSLATPPEPKWERDRRERERKRRAERAMAHAKHRKDFLADIAKLRAGEFGSVLNPAQAYLKLFTDLGADLPAHERVAEWLGPELAEAAHAGFEAFLKRTPPHPSAARIAVANAKETRYNAIYILIAALAERRRNNPVPFDGVPSERLMAALFGLWRFPLHDDVGLPGLTAALESELRRRGDFQCAIRLYIEAQFKQRKEHVDQLHNVMAAKEYAADGPPELAAGWLRRYAELDAQNEAELIDCLTRAGQTEGMAQLALDRLSGTLNDERRRNWQATLLLVESSAAIAMLDAQPIEPALLWHLRARAGGRWQHERHHYRFSPLAAEWIFSRFRGIFSSVPRQSGMTYGDTNPSDASDFLGSIAGQLARNIDDEATAALARLRAAPQDGYTDMFVRIMAEQAQLRAEQYYQPPQLTELIAVMNSGPPANARDLQAVLLSELEEVQARLKGDPLDWYKGFFREDGRHKAEEACRDELLKMLDGRLAGVSLHPESHGADDKRVDIVAQIAADVIVPIEIKGQWHRDLWTAADQQLDHLYVNDRRAAYGIYIVLWFGEGTALSAPPNGAARMATPQALQAALAAMSKAAQVGRVEVVVLDFTRPVLP